MSSRRFEIPTWVPTRLQECSLSPGDDAGSAVKFGLCHPLNIVSAVWNRIGGVAFGFLSVILSVYLLSQGTDSRYSFVVGVAALATASHWFRQKGGLAVGRRAFTTAIVLGAAFVSVSLVLQVAGIVAIPAAIFAMWLSKKRDDAWEAAQRELSVRAEFLKPWAVFWAYVANDDPTAPERIKRRPCIALPPRATWINGIPPIDEEEAGYRGWFSSYGYPVLICTSQVKRHDDPRYIQIRPFPTSFQRSFVLLSSRYFVPQGGDKAIQLGLLDQTTVERSAGESRELDGMVVLDDLGPLLNYEDRRRIAAALAPAGIKDRSSQGASNPATSAPTQPPALPPPVPSTPLPVNSAGEQQDAVGEMARRDNPPLTPRQMEELDDLRPLVYRLARRVSDALPMPQHLNHETHWAEFQVAVLTAMIWRSSAKAARAEAELGIDFSNALYLVKLRALGVAHLDIVTGRVLSLLSDDSVKSLAESLTGPGYT